MRKFSLVAVALVFGLSGLAATATTAVAAATPNNAPCGASGAHRDTFVGHALTAAQIRNGSSTSCPAVGAAQPSDPLHYFCFTVAGSFTWTYLQDNRTGVKGWVRDDLLFDDGSFDAC